MNLEPGQCEPSKKGLLFYAKVTTQRVQKTNEVKGKHPSWITIKVRSWAVKNNSIHLPWIVAVADNISKEKRNDLHD